MHAKIKSIDIGTEKLVRAEDQESNVSTIEITVTKTGSKQPLGKQIRFPVSFAALYPLLRCLFYFKFRIVKSPSGISDRYKKYGALVEYSW